MNPLAAELFLNELKNSERLPKGREYSPVIKDFALKHSFYSGSGYDFLRSSQPGDPGLSIPCRRTIRNVFPVNCEPGHLRNVIKTIGENIQNGKHGKTCTLVLDEASLHKYQGWDPKLKTYLGCCTSFGDGDDLDDTNEDMATQALVFMLVGLDGLWKHPIGYWFTNHFDGATVGTLVKQSLKLTHDEGIDVGALVFDGLPANITMANDLGANINSEDDMKNWFLHPSNGKKVYIILDACYMLKLLRNLLGDYKKIWLPWFNTPVQ